MQGLQISTTLSYGFVFPISTEPLQAADPLRHHLPLQIEKDMRTRKTQKHRI